MAVRSQAMAIPRQIACDSLLRRALMGNALFTAISGALMVAGSGKVSEITGLTPVWLPAAIGRAALLWAIDDAFIGRGRRFALLAPGW